MATITPLQLPENLSPAKEMIVIVTDESNKSYAVRLSSLGWPYNPALDLGALTVRVESLEELEPIIEELQTANTAFMSTLQGLSGALTNEISNREQAVQECNTAFFMADQEIWDYSTNLFGQCASRVCEPVPVSPITINPAGLIEDQSIPYPGQITPGSFWRDALGTVHLQGYYRVPQLVNVAAWVCEIPQQYAPANGLVFCVGAGSGTFVLISPDGRFYVHRTNWTAGAFVAFSQISYRCKGV